jgi:hypothetical protein
MEKPFNKMDCASLWVIFLHDRQSVSDDIGPIEATVAGPYNAMSPPV